MRKIKLLLITTFFISFSFFLKADETKILLKSIIKSPYKACKNVVIISKDTYANQKSNWDEIKKKCSLNLQLADEIGLKNLNPLNESAEYLNFSEKVANQVVINLKKSQNYAECSIQCFSGQAECKIGLFATKKIKCEDRRNEITSALTHYAKEIRHELALSLDSSQFINVNIYNAPSLSPKYFINNNLRDFDLITPNPIGRTNLTKEEYAEALKKVIEERAILDREAKDKNVNNYYEWIAIKLMKNFDEHRAKYRSLIYEEAPIFAVIDEPLKFDLFNNPEWTDKQLKEAFVKLNENAKKAEEKVNWSLKNGKLEFNRINGEAIEKFMISLIPQKNEENDLLYYIGMKNQVEEVLKEDPSKCAIATAMYNRIETKEIQNSGALIVSTFGAGALIKGTSALTSSIFRIGRGLSGAEASAVTGMSLGSTTLAESMNKFQNIKNEATSKSGLGNQAEGQAIRTGDEVGNANDNLNTSLIFFPIDIFTSWDIGKLLYNKLSQSMFKEMPELQNILKNGKLDQITRDIIVDKWIGNKVVIAFKKGILNQKEIDKLKSIKDKKIIDDLFTEIDKTNPHFFDSSNNIELFLKAIAHLKSSEKISPTEFKNISLTISRIDLTEVESNSNLATQLKVSSLFEDTLNELTALSKSNPELYAQYATDYSLQNTVLTNALKKSGLVNSTEEEFLAQCTIPGKIAPDNNQMCSNFLDLFLKKNMIKRVGNDFELKSASNYSYPVSHSIIYHEKFLLIDGASINTRDVVLGKTLTDDRGRKWLVSSIINTDGYFELKGNGYIYRGNFLKQSSNEYREYLLKVKGIDKNIKILIPETDAQTQKKYLEIANELIKKSPVGMFQYSEDIIFANAPSKLGLKVNGTFTNSNREIIIYPHSTLNKDLKDISRTFMHEHGHSLFKTIMYQDNFIQKWMMAIKKDQRFVTNYAKTNYEEDFCETIAYYVLYDGGLSKMKYRKQFANRFELLDEIFNASPDIKNKLKNYLRIKRLAQGTAIFAGGKIYYSSNTTEDKK